MGALDRLWSKWPLWVTIFCFFSIGLLLILLPALIDWEWDRGVAGEIGVAFLTAAILGGSIHVYLERDIAKDAFEGAVGYFLPPDVKQAVRFISGLEWFAEEFSLVVELEKFGPDLIKMTMHVRRYLKNITNSTLSIKSHIHIDDWGHREKSYVIACELRTKSMTKRFDRDNVKYENSTVYAEAEEVNIGAGEHVELLASAVEFKRLNDDLHYAMPYASRGAKIIISKAPDDLNRFGGFSSHLGKEKHPHLDEYTEKSFCLPWQRAIVRWWPKERGATGVAAS